MNHRQHPFLSRRAGYVLLLAALLLVACGKKGPLYLPDPAVAPAQTGAPAVDPSSTPARKK